MKIMLLLGSGVSYKTGLPNVNEITEQLLRGDWYRYTDRIYGAGTHPNPAIAQDDDAAQLQSFLSMLKDLADTYLFKRRRPEANYEDLYYLCDQIADDIYGEIDNPAIGPFIEKIEAEKDSSLDLRHLATRSCSLIECVVDEVLYTKKSPIGLDLIKDIALSDRFKRLDIATLNHDVLVERLLKDHHVDYDDGFSSKDGDVLFFDRDHFLNGSSKVSVIKLHGSIDWYRYRITVNDRQIDRWGRPTNNDHWHAKNSNGELFTLLEYSPIFLTGLNKERNYPFGIFSSVHRKWDDWLFYHDIIVMSGYGWNDKGANGKLFEWLLSSSDNKKIILLHPNPEELKNSKSGMRHRFEKLVENQMIVLHRSWLCDTELADLMSVIYRIRK